MSGVADVLIRLAGFLGRVYVALVMIFLLSPVAIIFITSLTSAQTVQFPPPGLSLQWYGRLVSHLREAPGTKPGLATSIASSAALAASAAALAVVTGLLAAYALARGAWRGRDFVRQVLLLPIMFPQIIIGIGLLVFFSEVRQLSTFQRLIVGYATISLPYVVLIVGANLELYDRSVEEAALGLGASPVRTFVRITLPLVFPGLLAGGIFAFIVAFTNFTLSFFMTSGAVKPMPLWLFEVIEFVLDPMLAAVSVFLILMTVLVALLVDKFLGIARLVRT